MPHLALDDAGSSTLDLPGDRPLLVTGDSGWAAAARSLADTGAPLGVASLSGAWQAQFDIARSGGAFAFANCGKASWPRRCAAGATLLKSLGGAAAAWPFTARAQQPGGMRRVGVLIGSDDNPEARALFAEFQPALEQLGWTYGRNVQIDIRWGSAPSTARVG